MKITIEVIKHEDQRYETVGDWVWNGDDLNIYVSSMDNWRYEMLVAFHEMAECLMCKHRGIAQEDVDNFDIQFEKLREDGDVSEPGDQPNAPYYREHQIATILERTLALELGVNWKQYDDTVVNL
jgi:hypothetical protein